MTLKHSGHIVGALCFIHSGALRDGSASGLRCVLAYAAGIDCDGSACCFNNRDFAGKDAMKTEVQEMAPCRQKITVEFTPEEVDAAFTESYESLMSNVAIKGFRRGHVPLARLKRQFGKDVAKEVCGKLVEKGLSDTLEEKSLKPMGEFEAELDDLTASPGESLTFSGEIDIRPDFELPEYEKVEVEDSFQPAAEEDVDQGLEEYRRRFADEIPTDEPAGESDLVDADIVMTCEGKELWRSPAERAVPIRLDGANLAGIPVEDFAKKLAGISKGESRTLDHELPEDYSDKEVAGKTAKVEINAKAVKKVVLPEVNDEFAKRLGMSDLPALREQVKASIEASRKQASSEQLEQDIVDKIIELTPFDLPQGVLERQKEVTLERTKNQFIRAGIEPDALDERADEIEEAATKSAERTIRRVLIFQAIAEKEEISVSEGEFQGQIQTLANHYRVPPAKMLRIIERNEGGVGMMLEELRDIKVTRFLMDKVSVKGGEKDSQAEGSPAEDANEGGAEEVAEANKEASS